MDTNIKIDNELQTIVFVPVKKEKTITMIKNHSIKKTKKRIKR